MDSTPETELSFFPIETKDLVKDCARAEEAQAFTFLQETKSLLL
jgi:hypothetical protein